MRTTDFEKKLEIMTNKIPFVYLNSLEENLSTYEIYVKKGDIKIDPSTYNENLGGSFQIVYKLQIIGDDSVRYGGLFIILKNDHTNEITLTLEPEVGLLGNYEIGKEQIETSVDKISKLISSIEAPKNIKYSNFFGEKKDEDKLIFLSNVVNWISFYREKDNKDKKYIRGFNK
jgi:hypothetical protein